MGSTGRNSSSVLWGSVAVLLLVSCGETHEERGNDDAARASKVAATPACLPAAPIIPSPKPAPADNSCNAQEQLRTVDATNLRVYGHQMGETLEESGLRDVAKCDRDGVCTYIDPNAIKFAFDSELFSIEATLHDAGSKVKLPMDLRLGADLADTLSRLVSARTGPWTVGSNDGGETMVVVSNFAFRTSKGWLYWMELTFEAEKLTAFKLNTPIT